MSDSVDGYYLAAYCINATSYDRAEVEWIVVSKSLDGEWVDRDGHRVWAFYTIPITEPTPDIPDGWIEYLHLEADRTAIHQPKLNLATALGIKPKTPPKIERRL
jgi:hypothetical protein